MAYYPFSILSYVPLGVAYAVMLLFYGFLWWYSSAMKARATVRVIGGLVLLLLPVSEELWIAWNFARACETAGTFVTEKVVVDGFYDTTRETHAGPRNDDAARDLDRAGYRFYEMVLRDEKGGPNRVVHLEKRKDVWESTVLDHPTARYQYLWRSHIPVARKVVKHESIVIDTKDQSVIGRETIVGRYPPWFFIGLDAPQMQCYGKNHLPGLVYTHVLIPNK